MSHKQVKRELESILKEDGDEPFLNDSDKEKIQATIEVLETVYGV